jgi:phage-related protein
LKIDWTLGLLETIEKNPEKYFKSVSDTNGLFEIRVEYESNIFRIFSFFDSGYKLIVINGFIKKSNKTPKRELKKAINIKNQYFKEIDGR